ncbi:hypothetical protein KPL71_020006 [Citrus sinensis]|uniref:Uncharacterized protein n=1 Tax=Citrus sinensis TaxID=2711 RepID=A0ACB8J3U1_CITSI|nr:hypothetical protein KPL71_020006 [Citrus sinensis]
MSSEKRNKEGNNKLSRYLKAPVKMLIKARDFYIRSITACSDSVVFSSAGGVPIGSVNTLPRSYSTNSSRSSRGDEDFRELVRANSMKILASQNQIGHLEFHRTKNQAAAAGKNHMLRSNSSAAIGRIDEDKPCDFEDDLQMKPAVVFPRSKSYAVSRRSTAAVVSA